MSVIKDVGNDAPRCRISPSLVAAATTLTCAVVIIGAALYVLHRGPDFFLQGWQINWQLGISDAFVRYGLLYVYVASSFITGLLLAAAVLYRWLNKPFLYYYGYAFISFAVALFSSLSLWGGAGLDEIVCGKL